MSVADKVALVADASEGAAQAVARELLRRGWTVVLSAADEDALDSSARELRQLADPPERLAALAADPLVREDREGLVEFVLNEFQRIDMLVSVPTGPSVNENLLELSEQAYEQVMSACVTGPLFVVQWVANEMVRLSEAGLIEAAKIVLVNSICAYTSATERAARSVAAAATAMLTRLFADGLGEHGINVYEVRAGLISGGGREEARLRTRDMTPADPVRARYDRLIADGLTPIRRWGRPQDIALAVAAIADDLLPYSTGEVINVDGGFHLRRL